jgi:hypothetical protein
LFAAELAKAVAEELDEPLAMEWLLAMALASACRSVLSSPWLWP